MRKRFIGTSEIIFLILSFICILGAVLYLDFFVPFSIDSGWKEVRIPEGVTYRQGIEILKKNDVIRNKFMFLSLGRVMSIDRKLRAGYYNFNTSMTSWQVFNHLRNGMIVEYEVTVPEGSNLEDIRSILKENDLVNDDSWQLVTDKEFLDSLKIDAPSLEGYIYPDTYNFAKGADPGNIFSIMVHRLRENFDEKLRKNAEELGMTENEVLTLASIIEKEALYNSERPIISAVYHNRLKKKMRLQADPTVVYGVKSLRYRITKRDLKRDTPYNTYIKYGLPPGPICSPGIKSIKAALNPAGVDYLYFVSKNNGRHYFSRTGKEHLRAVRLYQRKNRNNGSENGKNQTN